MPKASITKTDLELLNMTFDRGLDIINRVIYIFDDIDENMAEAVVKGLNFLSRSDGHITIMINSQGGAVSDMFAIYDAIRACPNEIITIGIGEVCSAAGLLLVAGDKRLASKNCMFMAHSVQGGYTVDEDPITAKAQIAAVEVAWDRWAECMEDHTNQNKKYWSREIPAKLRELWLTPEEMKMDKYNIIDGIWE